MSSLPSINTPTVAVDPASVPYEGFEGPEKKLELEFAFNKPISTLKRSQLKGLRRLNGEEWQRRVLDKAKCTIISTTVNKHFDSYVLSESSLFVYPTKVMIKTCGTTTLLNAVEPLLEIAKELDMTIQCVFFSRKNFVFPHRQPAPHQSFQQEVEILDQYFDGNAYVIGALNKDHWYLYLADHRTNKDAAPQEQQVLEVLMHDLCPKKMKQFMKDDKFKNSADTSENAGITNLLPGSVIDSFMFDPCGYSMNGLLNEAYSTIHITPEAHCSYVSYETNCLPAAFKKAPIEYYNWLVTNVVEVFRPGRFTVTLFADDDAQHVCSIKKSLGCFDELCLGLKQMGYKLINKSFHEFVEGDHNLTLVQFVKVEDQVNQETAKAKAAQLASNPLLMFLEATAATKPALMDMKKLSLSNSPVVVQSTQPVTH